MIQEEMLRAAAAKSYQLYTENLIADYDPANQHTFSPKFTQKIKRLNRKASHATLYRIMQCAASIALALLIAGSVWLTADVEARADFFGWIKEKYETCFVYRFIGDIEVDESNNISTFELGWIPDGYTKIEDLNSGSLKSIIYANDSGQMLKFIYSSNPNGVSFFIDANNGELQKVTVGEYEADVILFDDPQIGNAILWTDHCDRAFYISAFLNESDLLKIANSIYEN